MSSQRKLKAARANGALAKGRKTPTGIARSAMNATRHGLLATSILLKGEDTDDFKKLHRQFLDRFLPNDVIEEGFIEEMVSSWWRMRRAWSIERELIQSELFSERDPNVVSRTAKAFAYLSLSPGLNLVHRYEARLQRNFQRAMDNLLLLREDARLEAASVTESQPPHHVPPPPNPVSERSPAPPTPSAPLPDNRGNMLVDNDLADTGVIQKPVLLSRPIKREQNIRNDANPISEHPAEVPVNRELHEIPPGGRPKPSGTVPF
ncbi:MAG: hypothetical protein EXQ52_15640 [Bryobacterales bacterium]|nr:hypothetical protein [Bryobacterales bacterium]